MTKSKTLIDKQAKRKLNPEVVETIIQAKKNDKWNAVASVLSQPRRVKISLNLEDIDKESAEGDIIVVPGKVLSLGELTKKIRLVALSFSEQAEKKLKAKGCEIKSILQEIKSNPKAEGVKIVK